MKKTTSKFAAFFAAFALAAVAAIAGYTTVLTNAGDPNSVLAAEAGTLCTDTSSGGIYVKTGTTANTGWVALKTDALGNGLRGTITLSSGSGVFTNAAITTNSRVLVTASGTAAAGHLGTTLATGTLTVQSTSGSDARTVTYLIFNP